MIKGISIDSQKKYFHFMLVLHKINTKFVARI